MKNNQVGCKVTQLIVIFNRANPANFMKIATDKGIKNKKIIKL